MLRALSYRHKIPLAFVAAILLTAVALSVSSAIRTYETARKQLRTTSERIGAVLAESLADPMRKDAVWESYLIVQTLSGKDAESTDRPLVIVLDDAGRVFVSSDPQRYPVLANVAELDAASGTDLEHDLEIRAPIAPDVDRLGHVVVRFPRSQILPPLYDIVGSTAWTTIAVLAILAPVAWFWGGRMAAPLVHLADSMGKVASLPAEQIEPPAVHSRDEIGRLAQQFRVMLAGLAEKREVERQMMANERLAAVGRLAAGVAHEINNPLGGMLNSLSTYRRHGAHEDLNERTVSLLERGLCQIKETVSALLVEAKLETHPLSPADIDDVYTLMAPELKKKHAKLTWSCQIVDPVALPSTQVRQVLINLLLNATKAISDGGVIGCEVARQDQTLCIVVEDDGDPIPDEMMDRLFEPFASESSGGSGLGLWVTYQIVRQFGGDIFVMSHPGLTQFRVELPMNA